jgi:hypothetical protein
MTASANVEEPAAGRIFGKNKSLFATAKGVQLEEVRTKLDGACLVAPNERGEAAVAFFRAE